MTEKRREDDQAPSPAPRILIVGLMPTWKAVARLPRALQDAGFKVGIVCFETSFLAATRFCDRCFLWRSGLRGDVLRRQLEAIVQEWQPHFLVPGDDMTVAFLARVCQVSAPGSDLAALLKRSLGNPASLLEAGSKCRTLEKAAQLGIRTPANQPVHHREEILAFARGQGLPILLKPAYGFGGNGIIVCRDEREIDAEWKRITSWKYRLRAWRKQLRRRIQPQSWMPVDSSISVNQFISGEPAMCLVMAVAGRVLAGLAAQKVRTYPSWNSPSSVVCFVPGEEMRRAAGALVGAWGLTGFISFDFIMDAQGRSWLVECNPRLVAIAHLGARAGEDLCLALYHHLTGQPTNPSPTRPCNLVVAHFPSEWQRDPSSVYLTEAFHDVPWDDPELLRRLWRDTDS